MERTIRIPARWLTLALVLALVAAVPAVADPPAFPNIIEQGYHVRVIDQCGQAAGPPTYSIPGAVCSEGGQFGNYIYYSEVFSEDPGNTFIGRMRMSGHVEPAWSGGLDYQGGLYLSPPASFVGERLLVEGRCLAIGSLGIFAPTGALQACKSTADLPFGYTVFDTSGDFGHDAFTNVGTGIIRVTGFGSFSSFAPAQGRGTMRFGPGGDWGTNLYVTGGEIVDPDGNPAYFPYGFTNWDWPAGAGWGGDLFDEDGSGNLWRVKPDGSATLFATGVPPGHVLACGGRLWVMASENCLRISPPGGGHIKSRILYPR